MTQDDIVQFRQVLLNTKKERQVHGFLAERPHLVVNADSAYGCRWIKSNAALGNEFVPDFMIARLDSGGLRWTLLELQDANREGRPASASRAAGA